MGGELGAEERRAEDPDRDVGALAGDGADRAGVVAEVAEELDDVLREAVGGEAVAAERAGGGHVGAGGAAEAEVDAVGEERRERAERLGDGQGRVVRQHDAAGADADGRVAAATWPISTAVAALAMPGMLWCSASQKRR